MSDTQNLGVIPASIIIGVREGACRQIGHACKALLEVIQKPGHLTHPEWYEPHFRRIDATRHLLDALGWGGTPQDVRLDFSHYAETLLAVVLSEILCLEQGHQEPLAAGAALPAWRDLAAEIRLIRASQTPTASGPSTSGSPRLTPREAEILSYLRARASYAEIAADLHLSVETVRTYARQLRRKFGVTASSELASASDASPQ